MRRWKHDTYRTTRRAESVSVRLDARPNHCNDEARHAKEGNRRRLGKTRPAAVDGRTRARGADFSIGQRSVTVIERRRHDRARCRWNRSVSHGRPPRLHTLAETQRCSSSKAAFAAPHAPQGQSATNSRPRLIRHSRRVDCLRPKRFSSDNRTGCEEFAVHAPSQLWD